MTATLTIVLTISAVQAVVLPLVLSWFQQSFLLAEVLILSVTSGLMYFVPTIGATLSFSVLLLGLSWRLSPSNWFIDVLFPVSIARLACVPALMAVAR